MLTGGIVAALFAVVVVVELVVVEFAVSLFSFGVGSGLVAIGDGCGSGIGWRPGCFRSASDDFPVRMPDSKPFREPSGVAVD